MTASLTANSINFLVIRLNLKITHNQNIITKHVPHAIASLVGILLESMIMIVLQKNQHNI